MKISKLHIENFNQFKNLEIDLTYPLGHERAGEPLDKVCLIGQSGTGKSSILRIMKEFVFPDYFKSFAFLRNQQSDYQEGKSIQFTSDISNITAFSHFENLQYNATLYPSLITDNQGSRIIVNKALGGLMINGIKLNNEKSEQNQHIADVIRILGEQNIFGVYLPEGYKHLPFERNKYPITELVDFQFYDIKNIWGKLKEIVNDYNAQRTFKTAQLYNETKNIDSSLRDKKFQELSNWERENPNPLENIAKLVLDKILQPLKLSVHTELTIDIIKGEFQIPVKNIETQQIIPFDFLSSGTQNIIYPSLFFYFNKPKNSIILFDEVENSLFPDIQQMIIEHYTTLFSNNQFFFATHSPIIASSFDPWEIVELKFDKEGYVNQEQFYERERHVDNYKFNPKYLRWDAILTDVFQLDKEGNPEREKLLQELARVNNKLKKVNGKPENEALKTELLSEYQKIADKLRWKIDA